MGHPRMIEKKTPGQEERERNKGEEIEYRYKNNKGCIFIHPLLFLCVIYITSIRRL